MRFRPLLLFLTLPLFGCPVTSPPTSVDPLDASPIPVPDFTLTERSGQSVSRNDLLGKVWVASFVFVRCPGPCPQVTATMARLQQELGPTAADDLRLVTFTVDPERDNPKELTEYAARYRADPDRWLFLTGQSEADLHRLLKDGFKVTAQRAADPKGPGGEFDHSSRLVVVDKRGHIRGYYDGIRPTRGPDPEAAFEANLQRLKDKVAALRAE